MNRRGIKSTGGALPKSLSAHDNLCALCASVVVFLLSFPIHAGAWQFEWIASPTASEGEQTLFRHTYDFDYRPEKARIDIASQGHFIVYVNGYNVTTTVMEPATDSPNAPTATMRRYDVARFLHAGTNTIAVWHAPSPTLSRKDSMKSGIGLAFYGTTLDGEAFSYHTDDTWLCRPAGCYIYNNVYETFDATLYDADWKNSETLLPAWQEAVETGKGDIEAIRSNKQEHYISLTYSPISNSRQNDTTLVYHFTKAFDGWVRLTLRGMKQGAKVVVNGLTYYCSGETDEQCCRRFTLESQQEAQITLPKEATEENIFSVEGIEIAKRTRTGWGE